MAALRITGRAGGRFLPLNSNFYVAHPLNASPQLPLVPGLPLVGGNLLGQHRDPKPFLSQSPFLPMCQVALLRIYRVDLHQIVNCV